MRPFRVALSAGLRRLKRSHQRFRHHHDVPEVMMQVALVCGFLTAHPVNIWLINRGITEAM